VHVARKIGRPEEKRQPEGRRAEEHEAAGRSG
jgi:hypothetical protein